MSIQSSLLHELKRRFSNLEVEEGTAPNPILIIRNKTEIGDVSIWDDESEATIGIGTLTHGHFNPYDDSLTSEERERWIVEHLLDFLDLLFRDRVMVWSAINGGSGGWEMFIDRELQPRPNSHNFVWSGRLQ